MTIENEPQPTKFKPGQNAEAPDKPKTEQFDLEKTGKGESSFSGQEQEEERKEKIALVREKIRTSGQDEEDLIEGGSLREASSSGPVLLAETDKELILKFSSSAESQLAKNYQPGFGVFPSANPDENFYEQLWTRDFSHAASNYLAEARPEALKDSLATIFSHQRRDGALPLRVERQYMILKLIPGLRRLAKPVFNIIEKGIRGRQERPVYEGQDFSSAEDTVPSAIIAAGEFFINSPGGREFVEQNFDKIKKAVEYFKTKVDQNDGLASVKSMNADWADSINRGGKLGGINVLWARSLRLMSFMASRLGRKEEATAYRDQFRLTKKSIMEKLYDVSGAYFRAEEGQDRVDTAASVLGSLYLLDSTECVRVQESLNNRVSTNSGLKNFDPPYPASQIMWPHKLIGHEGYHNKYVWPWVTCENIRVKIKIALEHPEKTVRMQYKTEAVSDLLNIARLFDNAGGAYEIFQPDTRKPAITRWYKPPRNFMGNLVAYEGAYLQLKKLGWV
jgi:glycogen debranching enzyme